MRGAFALGTVALLTFQTRYQHYNAALHKARVEIIPI